MDQQLRDENENFPLASSPKVPPLPSAISTPPRTTTTTTTTKALAANPVVDNFEMTIENSFRCEECGHTSRIVETLLCLEVSIGLAAATDLDESVSLQSLFDAYFRREKVERRCDACGADTAWKTVSIQKYGAVQSSCFEMRCHIVKSITGVYPSGCLEVAHCVTLF